MKIFFVSIKIEVISISDAGEDGTEKVSEGLTEEGLSPFKYEAALGIYYKFLDNTSWTKECKKGGGNIAQLVRLNARIATVVHCLTEMEL